MAVSGGLHRSTPRVCKVPARACGLTFGETASEIVETADWYASSLCAEHVLAKRVLKRDSTVVHVSHDTDDNESRSD